MRNSPDLDRAAAAITAAESVALACHVAPDGDALGSMLGLHHLCRAMGKHSVASWPAPFVVAPHYAYLPGLDIASLATGFGTHTAEVRTTDELASEFKLALDSDGPTVIVVHTQPELPHLG